MMDRGIRSITGTTWTYDAEKEREKQRLQLLKPLSEQLQDAANAERESAQQYEGCTFYGEWPGSYHLRQAALLDRAAALARKDEQK
jgi:hypothetical protein